MKLKRGPLKVITFATGATLEENEKRARAGGKVFHPTVLVHVKSEEEGVAHRSYGGFGIKLPPDAEVKSSIIKFPHEWTGRRDVPHYWIETTNEVAVTIEAPTA